MEEILTEVRTGLAVPPLSEMPGVVMLKTAHTGDKEDRGLGTPPLAKPPIPPAPPKSDEKKK